MLDTHMTLRSGIRVRIRLPHAADRPGVDALHARLGHHPGCDLHAARTLHFDPRSQTMLCVTAWIGGAQTLVGYGAIEHGSGVPHLLVCDDEMTPGLRAALHDALVKATAHRRAA